MILYKLWWNPPPITRLCSTVYYREGIKIWTGKTGVYANNGQIIFTKNIGEDEAPQFLARIVNILQFPGFFSADAHGFVKHQDQIGFQFASQASSITLQNDKSVIFLNSTKTAQATYNYFNEMSGPEFLSNWFKSHDAVSDLTTSGFVARRVTTVVVYYEPTSQTVREIFK